MEIFILEVSSSCVFSWASHHNKGHGNKQAQLFIADTDFFENFSTF